jgi:hypothetical protein
VPSSRSEKGIQFETDRDSSDELTVDVGREKGSPDSILREV